ncbi:MAG: hypothetical protein E6H06_12520 [Bacteroidetes bacterium]|nr:MAG: hypothetical protein E6H06_12520 [Bacteroidota bacterium]
MATATLRVIPKQVSHYLLKIPPVFIKIIYKNTSGVYKNHLGFPGMLPDALSTVSQGYPDLLISGPSFEFPVKTPKELQTGTTF